MELLLWALVGGVFGTALIDIADKLMARANFTTGYS